MEVQTMKRTRILALVLAVCLCAALAVPASAASVPFSDVGNHWALSYILDMTEAKLFTGYGDGTFRPEDKVKNIEALALCARITQVTEVRQRLAADYADVLEDIFPGVQSNWWFLKEAATCMELGVIDGDTLSALNAAGKLEQPMTKADFAVYLVRGAGMEELARTLDAEELPFNDQAVIGDDYRPYVKLLHSYGVLTGDDHNNFNPDQPMSRAICATMLSRALDHIITERKVNVELPRYTTYPWTSGVVVDVDVTDNGDRLLYLNSEITGSQTVTLPSDTKIYQYNKEDQFKALKAGSFAKVCFAADGKTVQSVRVTPAALVERLEGDCGGVSADVVLIGGAPCMVDRFTQVSAGGKTGDRSIIDPEAHYTDAEAAVNSQGRVLWLKLSGGTRRVEGILTDVTVNMIGTLQRTSITVKGYNGASATYTVPENVTVLVNGAPAELKDSQEGRQVILRVDDADLNALRGVEVNLTDRYLQGILRTVDTKAEPARVELRVDGESRATRYELAEDCAVTYRGEPGTAAALPANSFITAKLEGGTITALYAWQGYEDTEGTLTRIIYGTEETGETVLEVTRANGSVARFTIPLADLGKVSFTSGGKTGDVSKLKTGDHVVVTVLYDDVTQVDYTPREANVSGTLDSITRKADGTAELVLSFANGTSQTYTATAATTVVQGGKPVALSTLNPGSAVSLVSEGDRAISIEITGSAVRQDVVKGAINSVDTTARIARVVVVQNGETSLVNVRIDSNTTIVATDGSKLTSIAKLKTGDVIEAHGGYATDGVFEAKLVIRE